jgi:hypothetical protein
MDGIETLDNTNRGRGSEENRKANSIVEKPGVVEMGTAGPRDVADGPKLAGLANTTPDDEKKAPTVVVSVTPDAPATSGGGLISRCIKWLTTNALKLQLAITEPGAPPHFQEPSGDETAWDKFKTFLKFMGPGAIISVAYIDPDNFQTNIAAGASFQYKQLFMLFVSVLMAIYLQVCAGFLTSPATLHSASFMFRLPGLPILCVRPG